MFRYLPILGLFLLAALVNWLSPSWLEHLAALPGVEASLAQTLWCLCLFLGFGWASSTLAAHTIFPNFTVQLMSGVLLHDALGPLAAQPSLSVVMCTALAAIILKAGGDEVERKHFYKIAFPTLMIAIPGYLITCFVMYQIFSLMGYDGASAALVAAIISSTDPAALIPTLKALTFKPRHRHLYDLGVAESAVNDTLATIVTTTLTAMVIAGTSMDSAGSLVIELLRPDNLRLLGEQILFGTLAGLAGWGCMHAYELIKAMDSGRKSAETSYDFAFVLAVPLASFLLAQSLHGNGFLAVFVAGLLANYSHAANRFHTTLHAMEIKIESVGKPVIFMMAGAFVAIDDLLKTFWPGLVAAAAFMLIARPLAVFISLLPTRISLREQWFMCAVRETGVIPVVLAVITAVNFPHLTMLMPLTAWIVIWTMGVLPALTPWWARKLELLQK